MAGLKRPSSVVLSNSDAYDIISFVFGKCGVAAKDLTKEDIGFAQAMLQEMLDASFAMGFVEALFRASVKPSSGAKKVIISFLKGAGKNMVKYKDKDDLEKMIKDPVIYKAVQVTLARNFKSVWAIRENDGGLSY